MTYEDVLKQLEDRTVRTVMVCRSAMSPMDGDSELCAMCAVCGATLQVTKLGRETLAKAANPFTLCEPCGRVISNMKADQGQLAGIWTSPAAEAVLKRRVGRGGKDWTKDLYKNWGRRRKSRHTH